MAKINTCSKVGRSAGIRHVALGMPQAGFSLVELMVVIVIVGVLASMLMLNLDGIDQRKAMQVRDVLIMDLKKISRESNDQYKVYALQTQAATDVSPFQYSVVIYQPSNTQKPSALRLSSTSPWQAAAQFPPRELPEQVSLLIEANTDFQKQLNRDAVPSDLVGERAPKLVWFGNGEAEPVTIQVYYAQTPVGAPVVVDYLGHIDAQ